MMSIAAVERDTGLSKDTLRVWERRYDFPQPVRDGQGERCYPLDQIEKLRLIKRLLDVGHRPSRLVSLPMQDLQALSERSADAQGLSGPTRRRGVGSGIRPAEAEDAPLGLRAELSRGLLQMGLSRFIAELVTPLLTAIGDGWLRGRIQIFQEHWATHYIQQTLHSAIQSFPAPQGPASPRVLLSTLPGEHHALGLLVVESWLCLDQAQAINLGPQTPLWDLVLAVQSCKIDIVALSFSPHAPPPLIQDGLADLRAKLPPHVALWAGGSHPLLQRKPPEGVLVLNDRSSLSSALALWRARHQSPR